jgi:hypothetical protein
MIFSLLRNVILLRSVGKALIATLYESFGHEWRDGVLRCPHPRYRIAVAGVVVETCVSCDPGA